MEKPGKPTLESVESDAKFPTLEEVTSQLDALTEGRAYRESRRREDEHGLYLLTIVLPGDDGGETEYTYMREGTYPEGAYDSTVIYVAHYDAEGDPIGGNSVAKYSNGTWTRTP